MTTEPEAPAAAERAAAPTGRRRGRAKGMPRVPGSGRKKGVHNAVTIEEKASTAAMIFKRLKLIASGQRVRVGPLAGPGEVNWIYPSLANQLDAMGRLLDKVLPSLRATEVTGADGAALIPAEPRLTPEERAAIWGPVIKAALEGVEPRPPRSAPAVVIAAPSKEEPLAACGGAV